jgi:hypothetical protein
MSAADAVFVAAMFALTALAIVVDERTHRDAERDRRRRRP